VCAFFLAFLSFLISISIHFFIKMCLLYIKIEAQLFFFVYITICCFVLSKNMCPSCAKLFNSYKGRGGKKRYEDPEKSLEWCAFSSFHIFSPFFWQRKKSFLTKNGVPESIFLVFESLIGKVVTNF